MEEYLTPGEYGEAELVEKRSRFIARVWRISDEEQALEHIARMRRQHWDATHNVYAYRLKSGAARFSDDGEPSGTSGLPTLEVFRKGGVFDVCCVVTRYFGGVLLGAGGLVRAYSRAATMALEAAGLYEMRELARLTLRCPYGLFERLRQETERWGGVERVDYGAEVALTALLPGASAEEFSLRVADITAGAVTPEPSGAIFRPVKLEK